MICGTIRSAARWGGSLQAFAADGSFPRKARGRDTKNVEKSVGVFDILGIELLKMSIFD